MVLRRIFEPMRNEVTGEWTRLHNKELYALYSSPNIIPVIKSRWLRWAGDVARMEERCIQGFSGKTLGKDEWGVDGRIILKWIFEKWDEGTWTGSILLRIGTGGGLLWRRWWTFGFHKMRRISWVAEDLLASQEGLCSMQLISYHQPVLVQEALDTISESSGERIASFYF